MQPYGKVSVLGAFRCKLIAFICFTRNINISATPKQSACFNKTDFMFPSKVFPLPCSTISTHSGTFITLPRQLILLKEPIETSVLRKTLIIILKFSPFRTTQNLSILISFHVPSSCSGAEEWPWHFPQSSGPAISPWGDQGPVDHQYFSKSVFVLWCQLGQSRNGIHKLFHWILEGSVLHRHSLPIITLTGTWQSPN